MVITVGQKRKAVHVLDLHCSQRRHWVFRNQNRTQPKKPSLFSLTANNNCRSCLVIVYRIQTIMFVHIFIFLCASWGCLRCSVIETTLSVELPTKSAGYFGTSTSTGHNNDDKAHEWLSMTACGRCASAAPAHCSSVQFTFQHFSAQNSLIIINSCQMLLI